MCTSHGIATARPRTRNENTPPRAQCPRAFHPRVQLDPSALALEPTCLCHMTTQQPHCPLSLDRAHNFLPLQRGSAQLRIALPHIDPSKQGDTDATHTDLDTAKSDGDTRYRRASETTQATRFAHAPLPQAAACLIAVDGTPNRTETMGEASLSADATAAGRVVTTLAQAAQSADVRTASAFQ